jgi:hypothetical protein
MMYPYTKFELNVCNCSKDNEQKPIYGMTKGNTICPRPFHGGGIKIHENSQNHIDTLKYNSLRLKESCTRSDRDHKTEMHSTLWQLA